MGGCRCTYRNCTVKSDGKTHMFHYPVFEKVRCHQWLLNAHRLEFLNLKVSQLKNRVICQHHFKDENFMNFKKDKLTFDAVPTEDGPYCDTTNYVDLNRESHKLFSIIIDDIDNDYNDKKANYSLKYGDFLANLDLMDIEKIDEDSVSYKNAYNGKMDILSSHKGRGKGTLFCEDSSFLFNISLPDKNEKKNVTHPTLAVSPYMGGAEVKEVKNYFNSKSNTKNNSTCAQVIISNTEKNIKSNQQQPPPPQPIKKEPKVKIISEKKVTNPVPITGKFELVSPNFVLNVSKRKGQIENNHSDNFSSIENKDGYYEDINNKYDNKSIEIEIVPLFKEEENSKPEQHTSFVNLSQNSDETEKSPKVSVIKTKVPRERVEAINKKREFNMKLRDMVESCLDNLDNSSKTKATTKQPKNTKTNVNKRKLGEEKSAPKNTPAHNSQEYTIAFLEARLRKMENTLLEKIEQNSMKIVDLKNAFVDSMSQKQAVPDEEVQKKQLFQDISKYLSPTSKSLIYEELFINKFSLSEPTTTPNRKRRKR